LTTSRPNCAFNFFIRHWKDALPDKSQGPCGFPRRIWHSGRAFETLTLIQTRKTKPFPVLIFGREFWEKIINFDALVEEGTISPEDIRLFQYVETAEEAWAIISRTYRIF
jgi:hypothetical protein